jgi:uncharacterized surface protein with fasciclin (FAS1) repeats
MKRSTLRRTGAAGAAIIALSMGLAACGDDADSGSDDAGTTTSSSAPADTSSSAAPSEESSSAGTEDAASQVFGDGCANVPADGAGSFNGMVQDPVATAASNNPLLKTLVSAVGVAGLGDTLNSAPALTVFAPTDDAFGKIPADTLKSVLADKATLTAILTHHVIGERLDPSQVVGEHETLNGDTITVAGDPETGMTVDGKAATVICGNVPTMNATVYIIDSVLMPTK